MHRVSLLLLFVVACSSRKPTAVDETKLAQVFDAIADRIVTDVRIEAGKPHKSRVAIAETVAAVTPVGFYRYADTLARFDVRPAELATIDPQVMERLTDRLMSRVQPEVEALMRSVDGLPLSDRDDCNVLARRVAELRASPTSASMAAVLATAMTWCASN